MNTSVIQIEWLHIGIALLPMLPVVALMFVWSERGWMSLYSIARMLLQLIAIGYFLVYIFEATDAWLICVVLTVMLMVASWIALSPVRQFKSQLYVCVLLALALGGGSTLFIVVSAVLNLTPWYEPRYLVPLAGMIFANCMNTVSIAAERFESELGHNLPIAQAKRIAFQSGMIPVINSMFAVGLVALPGMMTGQILSGVTPLVAVRYQIVVMAMLFAASGLSAALYLQLSSKAVVMQGFKKP
ncbi:ABC transporter permease [Pseudomonadales bacterium]|mgnify:FL=1|jgi:putative ABC transport system permease protein|nr:ABC transporter permease [Pseudomonadales bacterium]MDB4408365.1 ABC transporter permease [bacterium]MDA8789402.1 ABC transporter permease [Pseudomonadales bacterium]MDA8965541.1 ABC transporter permease [Pseudomonadales bacterium]MDB4362783.1 ABC transporter permease [Pseudomonadales bacterium]